VLAEAVGDDKSMFTLLLFEIDMLTFVTEDKRQQLDELIVTAAEKG
jgi:hypothetical protein